MIQGERQNFPIADCKLVKNLDHWEGWDIVKRLYRPHMLFFYLPLKKKCNENSITKTH